jgi:hypothetical protein
VGINKAKAASMAIDVGGTRASRHRASRQTLPRHRRIKSIAEMAASSKKIRHQS